MNGAPPFELFGTVHLVVLAATVTLCLATSRLSMQDGVPSLARSMAWLLLGIAVVKPAMFVGWYGEPLAQSLPLDLCRINEFLCVYMLLRRSYRAFEVAYFLAMAGSVSAILMPDLLFGFPDPRFVSFFLSHGLAVLMVLYAVFAYGFRPELRSVGITVAFLGVYTLLMAGVNVVLDSNYLFLCRKPEGASLMDFLGPWPVYVFGLMGVAVAACFLCYLPFAFRRAQPSA